MVNRLSHASPYSIAWRGRASNRRWSTVTPALMACGLARISWPDLGQFSGGPLSISLPERDMASRCVTDTAAT